MHRTRWTPRICASKLEAGLQARLGRTRKIFAFLYAHRREIFDDAFQVELASMYRATGAGKEPVPPALLAAAVVLQVHLGVSDAEAVELTVVDLRWQMVLDRLGAREPAFSQGALGEFRQRLERAGMTQRLFERVAQVARVTGAFDPAKLPRALKGKPDPEGAGS